VIGLGKPAYHINRIIEEANEPFNDEAHIIYVNGANKDKNTALGRLMHDFFCTNPDDMYYEVLAETVRYFKESEEGVQIMCRAMEEMRFEVAQAATMKANERAAKEVKKMNIQYIQRVMQGFACTVEQAMDVLSIPMEKREEYASIVSFLN